MNPGQTSSSSTPETTDTSALPEHVGVCAVCGATQPLDTSMSLVAQLEAFAAAHAHD